MTRNTEAWIRRLLPAIFAAALIPGFGRAGAPQVGEVQKLTVITISLQVGGTEKESKEVTYTPPPGWYVRSHLVDCTKKTGNSSFTVATVPQDWSWCSEEKASESYKLLIDLAEKAGDAGMQAKFAVDEERLLSEIRKVRSSHHALVVDATARGEGFLRAGGALELTVTAELVYVGTEESLARTVAEGQAKLTK
jgi:hypothetical protein